MESSDPQNRKVSSIKHNKGLLIFGGILAVILIVAGFFVVKGIVEAPRDLGPDLVYIGKEDYGCNILEYFFLCDAPRNGSYYYFGTNMTIDQLASYFSKAHYTYDPEQGGVTEENGYALLGFKTKDGSHEMVVYYFDNLKAARQYAGTTLSDASKKHVIEIGDYDYGPLKQALQGTT